MRRKSLYRKRLREAREAFSSSFIRVTQEEAISTHTHIRTIHTDHTTYLRQRERRDSSTDGGKRSKLTVFGSMEDHMEILCIIFIQF